MNYPNDYYRMLRIPLYDSRLPLPTETAGIFDSPTVSVCINEDWTKHLVSVLERLVWTDAWDDDYDLAENATNEVRKLILLLTTGIGECTNIGDNLLRQNPDDSCELQQSSDGGLTWSLAFDYSLCLPQPQLDFFQMDKIQQQLDALIQLYDALNGDVSQLYAELVYDGTSDDDYRDLALCASTKSIVDFICILTLDTREFQFDLTRIGLAFIGLVAVATGLGTPLGLAILALAEAGVLMADGVSDAILNNEVARQAVACCMYNSLKGATLTLPSFQTSVIACGFDPLSHEAAIAGVVSDIIGFDEDIFTAFLEYTDKNYRFAELGLVDCPCDTDWEHIFDFQVADGGWSILTWGDGWVSGKGWQSQDNNNVQELAYIEIFFSDTVVTFMEFEHWTDGTQPDFGAGSQTQTAVSFRLGGVLEVPYNQQNNSTPVTRTIVAYDNASGTTVDHIRITMNPLLDNPNKWWHKKVTLRGKGVNPFG